MQIDIRPPLPENRFPSGSLTWIAPDFKEGSSWSSDELR